jgi:hypothetical protein
MSEEPPKALADKFNVKHIRQEGARFHVHSWSMCRGRFDVDFSIRWCSEPFCEHNLPPILDCVANGLAPSHIIPAVPAREWLASDDGRAILRSFKGIWSGAHG